MAEKNLPTSEYEKLKKNLLEIGMAIPGTIHALYALCGSEHCECAKDKNKRHGPYYRWHYRVNGRQISIGISEQVVNQFEKWINNREELEQLMQKMLDMGAINAEKLISEDKLNPGKLKKSASRTSGK
jgi:hypothetical protein